MRINTRDTLTGVFCLMMLYVTLRFDVDSMSRSMAIIILGVMLMIFLRIEDPPEGDSRE